MVTLIVKINVEDFKKWKQAFDGAEAFRQKMGIELKSIYQSLDDENSITLISDYPSLEFAKKMLASPEWETNQRKSGVIGGFDLSFYNEVK